MNPDHLKSAIAFGNVDNTSLAIPSVNQYRSGQQRVLDQVQTVKRSKSKHLVGKGSGTLSPTSPTYDSVFVEGFKSLPLNLNGGMSTGTSHAKRLSSEKSVHRQHNLRTVAKGLSSSGVGFGQMTTVHQSTMRGYGPGPPPSIRATMGRANTSRSEPDLGRRLTRPKPAAPPQRLLSNRSSVFLSERNTTGGGGGGGHYIINSYQPLPQAQSHTLLKVTPQQQNLSSQRFVMNGTAKVKKSSQFHATSTMTKAPPRLSVLDGTGVGVTKVDSGVSRVNGVSGGGVLADITMAEAVAYLSSGEPKMQHCGASFIQHTSYLQDQAKQEVYQLNGIAPLVALLQSSNPQIRQTASAALRNLSFKDSNNKEMIQRCGGVQEVVALLQASDNVDVHKQLTGLLWNMSSAESLRPELVKTALPALMEKVVLPYTTGPNRMNSSNADPEVFYHATGCLRNFSSGKQSIRQSMRKYRGLVDSLVSYVEDCVEFERPDDKSVENCACVLHNLTFQLEAEAPELFQRILALGRRSQAPEGDTGPIGCFSPQSSKVLEAERHFDYPVVEEQHPTGAGWLIHSRTLQSYLALLGSSQKTDTLEACCGALQNLTSHPGIVSNVISQTVVRKLNGLSVLAPLLRSPKINLQRNSVALVANLSKTPHLHNQIARKALPELLAIVAAGTEAGNESDDTLSVACKTAHLLAVKEPDMSKPLLTNNLVHALHHLSKNDYFPKSSKAAALFLYGLWSDKEMQSSLKKKGMNKSSFVNNVTTAAHKSIQVVD